MNSAAITACAEEIIRLADTASMAAPFSDRIEGFALADAYDISAEVLRRREDQGWKRAGRKIGFSNRTILEEYGVFEPIFGYMYDRTLIEAPALGGAITSLDGLVQPLIEPEIAFMLRSSPPRTSDPIELLDSIEWMAHGFEIVHCHFPGWKFRAPDTVADGGLHGRYVLGPRVKPDPRAYGSLVDQLSSFRLTLFKDGSQAAEGGGELVLGSPLNALAHLVEVLDQLPGHPPLAAGELITTGTLTTTPTIQRGEKWSTRIEGLPLTGLELRFE
jgi:2-oxo-3-hexenedioate decarboxylase